MYERPKIGRRDMQPRVIPGYGCKLGEGPLWNPEEELLYWCDIEAGRVFNYDPNIDETEIVLDNGIVGGFTFQTNGSLLLFMEGGAVKEWDDSFKTIIEGLPAEANSRFNDVVAGPEGRVYCGTMPTDDRGGRLYRLDTDGKITELLDDLAVPNGMGFSPDEQTLYFVESFKSTVYAFDYDPATGELLNQRVFVETKEERDFPDGLTVDADGHVWVARWDGGYVTRYTPDGTEERRVQFPASKVTSLAFGGPEYEDLYVTSAGESEEWETTSEYAGAVFHINLETRGKPPFYSDIVP